MNIICYKTALKMFKNDENIIVCSSKMYPGGYWNMGYMLKKLSEYIAEGELKYGETPEQFLKRLVNSYKWYNCTTETGNNIKYWRENNGKY